MERRYHMFSRTYSAVPTIQMTHTGLQDVYILVGYVVLDISSVVVFFPQTWAYHFFSSISFYQLIKEFTVIFDSVRLWIIITFLGTSQLMGFPWVKTIVDRYLEGKFSEKDLEDWNLWWQCKLNDDFCSPDHYITWKITILSLSRLRFRCGNL